jgi:hypothetical protein
VSSLFLLDLVDAELSKGFIPYFTIANAESLTFQNQTGGRGAGRRSHSAVESRNIMCGHIKRNDAAMRRFIQYLSMRSQVVVVLVRDGKTGKLLVRPPQDECWIMRGKAGVGRASRSEWQTIKEVGPELHEEMQKHRDWHFDFSEYYDVCVWSLEAGAPFAVLYNAVQQVSPLMLFQVVDILQLEIDVKCLSTNCNCISVCSKHTVSARGRIRTTH